MIFSAEVLVLTILMVVFLVKMCNVARMNEISERIVW